MSRHIPLITAKEAAEMLRVTTNVLAIWRYRKKGPPWYKIGGAIMYDRKELIAFRDECYTDPQAATLERI